MKIKRTLAALLAAAALLLFGGCNISDIAKSEAERIQSEIASELESAKKEISSELEDAKKDISSALDGAKSDISSGLDGAKSDISSALGSQSSQSSQNSQGSQSSAKSPGEKYYSMSDVKKLTGTGNLAKNTLEHIFDGTINSKGKATGYHYCMITDSKGSIIAGTESEPDSHGVFTAKVKVNNTKKNGFSSFFPRDWSPQDVIDAVNRAYDDALGNPDNPQGSLWVGYSGDLEIDMYLDGSKKITTAYPIYEGD